jgi:hypothetical protein
MSSILTILYVIYDAIFPRLFGEEAELRDPEVRYMLSTEMFPSVEKFLGWFRLNLYMPFFQPVQGWRHTRAVNQLLDDIGWVELGDIDF